MISDRYQSSLVRITRVVLGIHKIIKKWPSLKTLKRFNFQVYGLEFSNYGLKSHADMVINNEVCENKGCDYMCVIHSSYHWQHRNSTKNVNGSKTNQTAQHGLLGTTCMCPDGSMTNNTVKCSKPGPIEVLGIFVGNERIEASTTDKYGTYMNSQYLKTKALLADRVLTVLTLPEKALTSRFSI